MQHYCSQMLSPHGVEYVQERDRLIKEITESLRPCFRPPTRTASHKTGIPRCGQVYSRCSQLPPLQLKKKKEKKQTFQSSLTVNSTKLEPEANAQHEGRKTRKLAEITEKSKMFSLTDGEWLKQSASSPPTPESIICVDERETIIEPETQQSRSVFATYHLEERELPMYETIADPSKQEKKRKKRSLSRMKHPAQLLNPASTVDNSTEPESKCYNEHLIHDQHVLNECSKNFLNALNLFKFRLACYLKQEELLSQLKCNNIELDVNQKMIKSKLEVEVSGMNADMGGYINQVLSECEKYIAVYEINELHHVVTFGSMLNQYNEVTKSMRGHIFELQTQLRNAGEIVLKTDTSKKLQETRTWRWSFLRFEKIRKRFEGVRKLSIN
jgi:hypothetical protein